VTGYLFLRVAYQSIQELPFVQEVVLIILGTIATIAITAALLNKQSEVELEKEQRVKIFDLKAQVYFELIDLIEKIILKGTITQKDLISLEFLTHKVSTIAHTDVLKEYTNFLSVIKETASDTILSPLESDDLSHALATLCGKIRYDLISKDSITTKEVQKLIKSNIDKL
jgi:hypothetical protein